MTNTVSSNEVLLGAQGRVVIPVALRKALGLKAGERLIARPANSDCRLKLKPIPVALRPRSSNP